MLINTKWLKWMYITKEKFGTFFEHLSFSVNKIYICTKKKERDKFYEQTFFIESKGGYFLQSRRS